jgi:hypothetical protein
MSSNEQKQLKGPSDHSWDLFFIIGAPVIAFFLVSLVSQPRSNGERFLFDPETPNWFIIMSALMTHFHVLMVFVRSHLNKQIFEQYKIRFLAVPILGLIALWISPIFAGIMFIVALYWDEWHTQMQTFGFARIFDARAGNNPELGRKLDIIMIFILGLFPQIILLTFLPENVRAKGFLTNLALNTNFVDQYGYYIVYFSYPLIIFAFVFSLFYFYQYWKLVKNGYKISKKKMALMATTAFSAVAMASFYSLADNAHYFNIYHSLQYIYLVFFSETAQVATRFGSQKIKKELMILFSGLIIFVVVLAMSVAREMNTIGFISKFWLMSSLLHFWYDGFIWSVRRNEV